MLLVGGEIAESSVGWPGIFYFSGMFGVVWCVVWYFFASNSPEECPRISQEEKEAIQESIGQITNVGDLKVIKLVIHTSGEDLQLQLFSECSHSLEEYPNVGTFLGVGIRTVRHEFRFLHAAHTDSLLPGLLYAV